jgi:hypothetical protein
MEHEARKVVTVLFADVTGSTALGEELARERRALRSPSARTSIRARWSPAIPPTGRRLRRAIRSKTAEAEALARKADFVESHAYAFLDLAQILEVSGQPGKAVAALAEARRLFEEKGNTVRARSTADRLAELAQPSPSQ